jgi:hypothetical protein
MDFLSLKKFVELEYCNSDSLRLCGINFKSNEEAGTFVHFVEYLIDNSASYREELRTRSDWFQFGYNIPQIGKEFDLLRLGVNYNINIEYKNSSDLEKLKRQLERNHYYLKFLPQNTHYYSYSESENCLIRGTVIEGIINFEVCNADELIKDIIDQEPLFLSINEYNEHFHIKNYLVSPFNDIDRFLKNQYLLTSHQDNIKKAVIDSDQPVHMIFGRPGTGKSLLLYDIAKDFINIYGHEAVVVIHAGNLNQGHSQLSERGIKTLPIKYYKSVINDPNIKVVLIDESQRLYKEQLEGLIGTTLNNVKVVFSIDGDQTLHYKEIKENIQDKIKEYIHELGGSEHKLKAKIRSNQEIAQFIKQVFTLPVIFTSEDKVSNVTRNIQLKYFENSELAEKFMSAVNAEGFVTLGFTPSMWYFDPFDKTPGCNYVPHNVIGQEFDKVAVLIDNNFSYELSQSKNSFKLFGTTQSYYHSTKMLYQNLTRVREQLLIIVIKNEDVFVKLSSMLSNI